MIDLSKFPNAAPDEENVFFLRPNLLTLFPLFLGFVILLILPFAVWEGLKILNPGFFFVPGYETLYVLGASIFFLFAWLFLFQSFIDFFLDIWIVTTHRIIDITQSGLFGRTTSELTLDRVQDVTSVVKGFIPTFFDYGTIHIQTAGERERFVFENITHPTHVAKRILELAQQRKNTLQRSGVQMED